MTGGANRKVLPCFKIQADRKKLIKAFQEMSFEGERVNKKVFAITCVLQHE